MKFYVITKGSYSDYRIMTITVNKEKAELLRKAYSDYFEEAEIEEFEETDIHDCRVLYFVSQYVDGSIYVTNEVGELYADKGVINRDEHNGTLYFYVYADDEEHAKKIFFDKKAEYLARKNGVD